MRTPATQTNAICSARSHILQPSQTLGSGANQTTQNESCQEIGSSGFVFFHCILLLHLLSELARYFYIHHYGPSPSEPGVGACVCCVVTVVEGCEPGCPRGLGELPNKVCAALLAADA